MGFAPIQYDSAEYRLECALRQEVLRVPLGLSLFDEDLSAESAQQHFGWFIDDGTLAACAISVILSPVEAKIRQMAVRVDCQGAGYGRMLMTSLERHLGKTGVRHLSLHARLAVAGFYESLGFVKTRGPFIEVGIPHVKMVKEFR